ncbi:hypothetical protein OE749_01085 [Aestuariibacter sp. AA17]|uniref:SAF domain-containing protein n=1 Tax=Fluctibacter corallii TaxID=2984329 RepID=A0ABT3A3V9_9ALTE|nr:hypothetical protein [Aestuariibacter sp. AA17]MCV2883288.1 hypothetical protein [Aestuariibacter sp. AA17]
MGKWYIALVICGLLAYDFTQRIVITGSQAALDATVQVSQNTAGVHRLSARQSNAVIARFDTFPDITSDTQIAPKTLGMSEDEQRKQRGELDKIYAGESILTLRAIVVQQGAEPRVLIERVNVTDAEVNKQTPSREPITPGEVVSLKLNEEILGYVLTDVKRGFINLISVSDADRAIQLQLRASKSR